MAGLDPLSRGLTTGASFDPRVSEIAIPAANVAALRATLSTGDVVSAKVLPPAGGADFVEINGQQLAAALPSNVRPGDTMIIEVVAFEGDRLYVRNLGVDVSTGSAANATTRTGPMFVPDLADELSPATYSARSAAGAPLPVAPANPETLAAAEAAAFEPQAPTSINGGGAYAPPQVAVTRPPGTPVYFIATGGSTSTSGPATAPLGTPATFSAAAPLGTGTAGSAPSALDGVVARPPQLPGGTPPAAVFVAATVKPASPGAGPPSTAALPPRLGPPLETGLDPRSSIEAKIAASRATVSAGAEEPVISAAAAYARLTAAPGRTALEPAAPPFQAAAPARPLTTAQSEAAGQLAQRASVVQRFVASAVAAEAAATDEAAPEASAPASPGDSG